MIVSEIRLTNYRNYISQELAFSEGVNLFYGENGQGKTNLLEAIYLMATGKSHRTSNYNDLVGFGSEGFEIILKGMVNDREITLRVRYLKERGRITEINGIRRERISDVLGTMNMILFSPETLSIVKGSPAERRRFLDVLLCQTSRSYLENLQRYNKIIKNKSAALKNYRTGRSFQEVIPVFNEALAKTGGQVIKKRWEAIEKLNAFTRQEMRQLAGDREQILLRYKTSLGEGMAQDSDIDYEKELALKLERSIKKELETGQCLYGPHRDDMEMTLNDKSSRVFSSQGQQRSLALALILAELRFVEDERGEKPVLLLDDVMSELDERRREALVGGLKNVQTIITTTEPLLYTDLPVHEKREFIVKDGKAQILTF